MKSKKKFLLILSFVLIIIIAGNLLLFLPKPLRSVLKISPDNIVSICITTSSTLTDPIKTYYTYDRAQIESMKDALSTIRAGFTGWSQGRLYYPLNTTIYDITFRDNQSRETLSITTDGTVYYKTLKYSIDADQVQSFVAQLERYCTDWLLADPSDSEDTVTN